MRQIRKFAETLSILFNPVKILVDWLVKKANQKKANPQPFKTSALQILQNVIDNYSNSITRLETSVLLIALLVRVCVK